MGLILDPKYRARVQAIQPSSPAASANLQVGDDILRINGQPILSMADVQWILHHTPAKGDQLKLVIKRGEKILSSALSLSKGWRRLDDPTWRISAWGPTIMVLGGMRLDQLTDEERRQQKVSSKMALRASYVGWFRKQGAAKKLGFRKGDVLIEYDGRSDLTREADLLAYACTKFKPGDRVQVKFLRGGKVHQAVLPIQTRD